MKRNPSLNENKKRGSELESLLHSEHVVDIEKLVVGGDGLARIQFQEKSLVVFIPLTAPDEKVKIKIVFVEKNHLVGEVLEIISASASRRGDCRLVRGRSRPCRPRNFARHST